MEAKKQSSLLRGNMNDTKIIKINTVCFTGHRSIPEQRALLIPRALNTVISGLIAMGAHSFRLGGAIGFDTIAALSVLEAKELYPHITLDLILPCRNQTEKWNEDSIKAYNYILSRADSVEYICDTYRNGCMHERNRRLVDGSDIAVAYLERTHGGSAFTYKYAESRGLEIINIYDIIKS